MYDDPTTTIQLGTLLGVGIAIVSTALFLAWRDARRSSAAFQRRRKRRRAFTFKVPRTS